MLSTGHHMPKSQFQSYLTTSGAPLVTFCVKRWRMAAFPAQAPICPIYTAVLQSQLKLICYDELRLKVVSGQT